MGIIQDIPGWVYFLAADNGLTKIGCTSNINQRMRQLTNLLPLKTNLVLTLETENCTEWEKFFHDLFETRREDGEWFRLNQEDIDMTRKWIWLLGNDENENRTDSQSAVDKYYDPDSVFLS